MITLPPSFSIWRLSTGRKRIKSAIWWTLPGVLSFVAAWGQHALGFGTILLTISGLWWICAGTTNFFPIRHLRHTYRGLKLSGKKFHAHVNEEGFEVVGDLCNWRVRWPGVLLKGESKQVFIINSEDGHIFMFGKQYLSEEQQQELRRFI